MVQISCIYPQNIQFLKMASRNSSDDGMQRIIHELENLQLSEAAKVYFMNVGLSSLTTPLKADSM